MISIENNDWKVCLTESYDGYNQISFVNGVETTDGGTHVDYVINEIIKKYKALFDKKNKCNVPRSLIILNFFIFISATVKNPKFSSQTKTKLVSSSSDFYNPIEITDKFIKELYKSEITNLLLDMLAKKNEADERTSLRKLNSQLKRLSVKKLVDCSLAGKDNINTSLSITEGDSASAGFRKFRSAKTQALYPIRGKLLNVRCANNAKIYASEELKGIMSAMGLKIGEDPFKDGKCSLRIGEIRIYSDADTDGSHIAGLILNFVAKYWPSMIKNHRLARVNTPIIKATNTKNKSEQYRFYYLNEYKEWEKTHQASKYAIEYYKGLGALDDKEYQEIVQNPNIYYYELDDVYEEELDIWFGDDADKRKEKMSKTI